MLGPRCEWPACWWSPGRFGKGTHWYFLNKVRTVVPESEHFMKSCDNLWNTFCTPALTARKRCDVTFSRSISAFIVCSSRLRNPRIRWFWAALGVPKLFARWQTGSLFLRKRGLPDGNPRPVCEGEAGNPGLLTDDDHDAWDLGRRTETYQAFWTRTRTDVTN